MMYEKCPAACPQRRAYARVCVYAPVRACACAGAEQATKRS